MKRAFAVFVGCFAIGAGVSAGQRPTSSPAPLDAGEVAGIVHDAVAGTPAVHAMVLIAGTDIGLLRVTSTDASGHFAFTGLPAGRFLLGAGKPAYLAALYGAGRPGRPGTPITLDAGQKMPDVVLDLAKGGVVAGRVTDEHGQPVVGARVRVLPRRNVGDEVVLGGDAGDPIGAVTDDRGAYRVFDLVPGDYVVALQPRGLGGAPMRALGPADAGPLIASAPPPPAPGARRGAPPPALLPPTVRPVPPVAGGGRGPAPELVYTYASIYFPSTPRAADADIIHVAEGEERGNVDLKTSIVPLTRLEGLVIGASPGMNVQVLLRPADQSAAGTILNAQTVRAGGDGRFAFGNVPPGEYDVTVRTVAPPGPPGPEPFSPRWAAGRVIVSDSPPEPLSLALGPALSLAGRLRFEGLSHAPGDVNIRVGLRPTPGSAIPNTPEPALVSNDGKFEIPNIAPGRYRLFVIVPPNNVTQVPDWYPKTALVDGRDALDTPIDIGRHAGLGEVQVTLTDDVPEVAGTARDAGGHITHDCTVIAFSVDRRFWFPQSRRIVVRQCGGQGAFVFGLAAGLPPGEYYVGALSDLGPNEQFDSVILDELAKGAARVTLVEGDSKTVDVRLTSGRSRR